MFKDNPQGQTQYDEFEAMALRIGGELELWDCNTGIKPEEQIAFATRIRDELCKGQEPVAYITKRKLGGTEGLLRADLAHLSAKNLETHDFIPLYLHPAPIPADMVLAPREQLNRLNEIARLIGSIFAHGNFVAGTYNERELEKLLRENGTFWESISAYEKEQGK